MYIDLGSEFGIWTVNWLYYLNYEAIPRSSSICPQFVQGTSLGQAVTSCVCCDGIPRVVPVFSLFGERLHI